LGEAEQQAGEIERRWAVLRGDLRREASAFQPLLKANALEPAEAEKLRDLLTEAAALTDGQPPPERLPGLIDETFPLLEEAFNRVKGRQVRINDQCNELIERGKILEKELESLRRTGKASYRREVERMRDLLASLIGARPPLLCELLEIPDERWQDAVEAMLGAPLHDRPAARELRCGPAHPRRSPRARTTV
jgi:chromosome segregation ATPase